MSSPALLTDPPVEQAVIDFTVAAGMSEQEREVWYVLRNHEGAENAIKVPDLAERVGLGSRQVQRIVHRLIHDFGKAVGTSMREPMGLYHATTPQEREEVAALHRRRAKGMLATAAKIVGVSVREYVERHQLELVASEQHPTTE